MITEKIGSGKTPTGGNETYIESGVLFLRSQNIHFEGLRLDDVAFVSDETDREMRSTRVRAADSLLNITGASIGRVAHATTGLGRANVNQHVCIVRPSESFDARYLTWCLAGYGVQQQIRALQVGGNRDGLNFEQVGNLDVPYPPIDEQRRIADFLDAETSQIDQMIAIRRASRATVEEKGSSTIAAIATVGTGPTRQTSSPWIPETGADWEVLPLKRRWRIIDCKHRTPRYVEEGYPVISPGDVSPGRLDVSVAHRFVDEADYRDLADDLRRVRRGEIVYGRNASVGSAAFVDTDEKFTMGQDVCRITSVDQDQLFLTYFLNSVAPAQLGSLQIGSTFTRVNIGTLLELTVVRPPQDEQRRLAAKMDAITWDVSSLVASFDRQLALLAERRQALITAAVTGQIDVTTAKGVSV